MDEGSFKHLLTKLPTLTARQREVLLSRLKASASINKKAEADSDDWLLRGLRRVLKSRGIELTFSGRETKFSSYAKFRALSPTIRSLLLGAIVGFTPTRVQQEALGFMVMDLLAKWIQKSGSVVTAHTLMMSVDRVPEVVELSFPGYVEAGLLGRVLLNRG